VDTYIVLLNIEYQSGAAEAWWAHNPQVLGSKPDSDKKIKKFMNLFCFLSEILTINLNTCYFNMHMD